MVSNQGMFKAVLEHRCTLFSFSRYYLFLDLVCILRYNSLNSMIIKAYLQLFVTCTALLKFIVKISLVWNGLCFLLPLLLPLLLLAHAFF
jgi:hypothetical protein